MGLDAPTMLLLTLGIAVIAAGFLVVEWRALRAPALLFWSGGFAAIATGCLISPLRQSVSFVLGVWVANGLLVVAHLLFLHGIAAHAGRRASTVSWALLVPWALLLALPAGADRTAAFGTLNAALVSVAALYGASLLLQERRETVTRWLGAVFLVHGLFYGLKTGLVLLPGAVIDPLVYKGPLIQASLLWGILVEVLLSLLMAAAVRRRREDQIAGLAERDPLTGALNRRGFERRAAEWLGRPENRLGGAAVVLFDVDHFKGINDVFGHGTGDRLLVELTRLLEAAAPAGTLVGRLGGDEFAALVPGLGGPGLTLLRAAVANGLVVAAPRLGAPSAPPTVSMGATLLDDGPDDLDALLAQADAALYEAKRRGRDRLHLQDTRRAVPDSRVGQRLANVSGRP